MLQAAWPVMVEELQNRCFRKNGLISGGDNGQSVAVCGGGETAPHQDALSQE